MSESLHLQLATVIKRGPASTRALEKQFPKTSRKTLQTALDRACELGWVQLKRKATRGRKAHPAIWESAGEIKDIPVLGRHKSEPKVPIFTFRVSCVWDLGSGVGVKLPQGMGQIFRPLGEWEDTPEQRPGA